MNKESKMPLANDTPEDWELRKKLWGLIYSDILADVPREKQKALVDLAKVILGYKSSKDIPINKMEMFLEKIQDLHDYYVRRHNGTT